MDTLKDQKSKQLKANKEVIDFINAFVDKQSFVETDAFVCLENDIAEAPGEGVVSGFARVADIDVCLFATNPKVLKGSVGALNAKKITRAINNAVRMDKPLIAVWDTSGARFAEGIECLEGYASILRAYTVAYGQVPIISVINGNNLGISSYIAGVSDFVLINKDSKCATASPLVLSAKTNSAGVGSADSLKASGIATNVYTNFRDTLVKILGLIVDTNGAAADDPNRVCKGLKAGVGADAAIKEIFDKNSFLPIREGYADVAVTGLAKLGGLTVGVVATDGKADGGKLTADACVKISEFLNICQNAGIPVVTLVDSTGTAVCADDAALIREMSNLVYQINAIDVDMFSVVYGKAIGGAYAALVSPCEYKIAWECASVGALESESAARLLYSDEIKSAKNKDKTVEKLAKAYSEENCSALHIAKKGYFDNVIEPNLTRQYLLAAILCHVE